MAKLNRLLQEWSNRGADDYYDSSGRLVSMRAIEERLLRMKETVSYAENWKRLALREYNRHAHDNEYIAALLYLLDERVIPASELQGTIHLNLGHIYRQLGRAGVEWCCNTRATGARLRKSYIPYPGALFIYPRGNVMLIEGKRYIIPEKLEIYRSRDEKATNDDEKDEYIGVIEGHTFHPPIPAFFKVRPDKPPKFPKLSRR